MTTFGSSLKAALHSPLLPFWLVIALLPFGRSAELGTLLCLLGVIMLFARDPAALRQHPGARLLLWLLAAYVAAALFSALDSIRPGKSWSTVAASLRYVPLGLYACFAIRREVKLQALYVAVAAVVALWCVDAWVQAFTGWSLGGRPEALRVSGIFGADNLKLGPSLAVLSPFVLWAARRRWGRTGLIVAAVLVLGPVLLAGARSAWLCYVLVLVGFAWHEARTLWRFSLWCAAATLLLALAGTVAWNASARFHDRMTRSLLLLHGTDRAVDKALSGRLDIWRVAAAVTRAHPVNGVGVRAFRYAYPHFAPPDDHFVVSREACGVSAGACHPHQLLLEILADTGALGLALWLAAAGWAWSTWRKAGAAARARAFPATLALGVALFPLNSHLAFYSAWWGLLFAWLVGLWCAALYVEPLRGVSTPAATPAAGS